MKHCLVTGGSGLLGRHLIPILEKKYRVLAPNRQELNLSEPHFSKQLPKKMDCIIHLAQSKHFREFPKKGQDIFDVNVSSTMQLLDYALRAGVKHFVYTSTGGVYQSALRPIKENQKIDLKKLAGFYPKSKLIGEFLIESYQECMQTTVFRPFFIYGEGQDSSMLIPRLIQSVVEEKAIQLQGKEGMKINPIHVFDAAKAVAASLFLECSGLFNLAGPQLLSLREIGEQIGCLLNKKAKFEMDLSKEETYLIGDIDKLKKQLLKPKVMFKDGVNTMLPCVTT